MTVSTVARSVSGAGPAAWDLRVAELGHRGGDVGGVDEHAVVLAVDPHRADALRGQDAADDAEQLDQSETVLQRRPAVHGDLHDRLGGYEVAPDIRSIWRVLQCGVDGVSGTRKLLLVRGDDVDRSAEAAHRLVGENDFAGWLCR